MSGELHVVIGSGQVGDPLARLLVSQGRRVRMVRHSSTGDMAGVQVVRGDLLDAKSVRAAAEGAAVIYHCANPPYFARLWAEVLPKWNENLIAAAGGTGARLVVLDNVYAFGDLGGKPLNEDGSMRPSSRKGAVRAQVAQRLMEAHTKGEARVTIGRASDFWGPGCTQTYFGDQFWPDAFAGKPVRTLGRIDMPHTFHYIADVVAGIAALGAAADDVTGKWWMLPCQPPVTTVAMMERLAAAAGLTLRTAPVGTAMQRILGLFIKALPELREMSYQWDAPFVMDDARFRAAFPAVRPTDVDAGVLATVAWARAQYARA